LDGYLVIKKGKQKVEKNHKVEEKRRSTENLTVREEESIVKASGTGLLKCFLLKCFLLKCFLPASKMAF